MARLTIVVPYRAREEHLNQFIPHLRAYFARDKCDRTIEYQVFVIEQTPGLPFNRGALKNIGFLLGRDSSDYTCFHDVDYLPIWADYSHVDRPTPILWFGAEARPVRPGPDQGLVLNDLETYFGGAVLVPNAEFAAVDGYSNEYWGWGYEDIDLQRRFTAAGVGLGRRRGTFHPLAHINEGFRGDGTPTASAAINKRLFDCRWEEGARPERDGLSTVGYRILNRRSIPDPQPERPAQWEMVKVSLTMRPPNQSR